MLFFVRSWLIASLFSIPLFCQEPIYELIDLGFQDKEYSFADTINDQGVVAGRYIEGKKVYLFVQDIPNNKLATRFQEWMTSRAFINNNNEIAGSTLRHFNAGGLIWLAEEPFVWKNPFNFFQLFNFHLLGQPSGHATKLWHNMIKRNMVLAANEKGQYLVTNYVAMPEVLTENEETPLIWIYQDDAFTPISHPQLTTANQLNNHGQILGVVRNPPQFDAVIYNLENHTGNVLQLPGNSLGDSINDLGEVVGHYDYEGVSNGFLFMPSIGYIFFPNFIPHVINDKRMIIGHYESEENKASAGLVRDGVLYKIEELCNLIDNHGKKWESITHLSDINEEGWIIGWGQVNGKTSACLLRPMTR